MIPGSAAGLHGCIPIAATPFFDDERLDLESLAREIDWLIAAGASGIATLAIASEGFKLTESERETVIMACVATVARRVPIVVSVDGAGTAIAIERARRAAGAGADALMVLPASFLKPDQQGVFDYYARIGRSVDIPIIIQDAPQLTGVAMGPSLWARLAAEVDTIRYVKAEGTPQGGTISETILASDGLLSVFSGWGGLGLLDALERGAAGSMPAPNFTRLFAETQSLWEAGHRETATERFHRDLPFVLWSMQSVECSIATAKADFLRRGIFTSDRMREPYIAQDATSRLQCARWLELLEAREKIDLGDGMRSAAGAKV